MVQGCRVGGAGCRTSAGEGRRRAAESRRALGRSRRHDAAAKPGQDARRASSERRRGSSSTGNGRPPRFAPGHCGETGRVLGPRPAGHGRPARLGCEGAWMPPAELRYSAATRRGTPRRAAERRPDPAGRYSAAGAEQAARRPQENWRRQDAVAPYQYGSPAKRRYSAAERSGSPVLRGFAAAWMPPIGEPKRACGA